MSNLCSIDINQPADSTIESTWPNFLREFKAQVRNSFLLEHLCSGRHLAGTDTDGGGVNLVVDVGQTLVTAYPGLLVKVLPIATNRGSGTLTVKSGAVTIASGPLKLNGANVHAGAILAGQWIEVVWDGANWQVISGHGHIPSGLTMFIAGVEADGTEVNNTSSQTNLTPGVTLPANSYAKVIVEAGVYVRNNSGDAREFTFKIMNGTTAVRTFLALRVPRTGNTENTQIVPLSTTFSGGQTAPSSINVAVIMSAASENVGARIAWLRAWGVT